MKEVPDFNEAPNFWGAYREFLEKHGYIDIPLPLGYAPACYYLAYGYSKRGIFHACIYKSGQLVHDPHPDGSGLKEVEEVHLIVPVEL